MSASLSPGLPWRLWRDERGNAAEFALVVPAFLVFLLGTIDVGRFIWAVNENAKAVQIGARWAVATDIIPGGDVGCATTPPPASAGMKCYSYAIHGGILQGTTVPEADFPTTVCSAASDAASLACTCTGCPFDTSVDGAGLAAFNALATRMHRIQPRIDADNIVITYEWSGLGYAGDPNGPDVSPMVTVALRNMEFRPIFLGGMVAVGLPGGAYGLTMEDGDGGYAN